ncbi:ATP-binding cassette domain-containing protein, partial [Acidocella sp.]|uniref:ATP-binding cassette domain-containing protein n=1 Tax=Acidocella sp. TaxID=50710 RepID=UPI00260E8AA1
MSEATYALEARDITKRFGQVQALHGISLNLKPGEMLGILGDNGAGKSTLMKILSGFHAPTTGELLVKGKKVEFTSVDHARSFGIECVYQDLALVNTLSVYHNMFLNREILYQGLPFLNHRKMRELAAEALADIGVNVPSMD